jgi:ATP-dependent metalloprotease
MTDSCCYVFSWQLAHALVEHETLNADEVRKVIKGEPIRNIKELISEDLPSPSTESIPSSLESKS